MSVSTLAELYAEGSGIIEFALEIPGIGVFSTSSKMHSGFTAVYGSSRCHDWMQRESIPSVREDCDPLDAKLDVSSIRLTITDVGGAMTALLKDQRSRGWAYLTQDLDEGHTTNVYVDSPGDCASAAKLLWIDQEVVEYTTQNADRFTTLTRGALGTEDADHEVDLTTMPKKRPIITDGPHTLVGRRAYLHAAVYDAATGLMGSTTCIYRGRVGKGLRIKAGRWTIPIEHISKVLYEPVATALPSGALLPNMWFSGVEGSLSSTPVVVQDASPGDPEREWITVVVDNYQSLDHLAAQWNARVEASSLSIRPKVRRAEGEEGGASDEWELWWDDTEASHWITIHIAAGSPLTCFGFAPGVVTGAANAAGTHKASEDPVLFHLDLSGGNGLRPTVDVATGNGALFTADQYVFTKGNPYIKIESISGDELTLYGDSYDYDRGKHYIQVVEPDDMRLQHCFVLSGRQDGADDLDDALQKLLGLDPTQTEPKDWCATGMVTADIDLTELADALTSVPQELNICRCVITKTQKVWDIIGPQLGLLGISPRIKSDGRIGFWRMTTPIASAANSVAVDASVWEIVNATQMEASLDASPLVNLVKVVPGKNYLTDKWAEPIKIEYHDGVNALGKTRAVAYKCQGLQPWGERGFVPATELQHPLDHQITATHYGPWGRYAIRLEIPCTYVAKQFVCGDIVQITHTMAPDIEDGTTGMSSKLGIVVGTTRDYLGTGLDTLVVVMPPTGNGAGIAPCALATSYDSGTKVLTFADTTIHSTADLSYFEAGQKVMAFEYNVASPTVIYGLTIDSLTSGKMSLTTDAWGGSFPVTGVWITPNQWDDGTSAGHQNYAFIASGETVPKLDSGGANEADAKEWTI